MTRSEFAFLAHDGELARLIRDFDWASTSLGPLSQWPQAVKLTSTTILQSPVPIVTLWGEEGIMIYNDAYSVFAGGRHPRLLGSKVREGWPEVADFNDNVMKVGLAGGTLAYQDQELTLHRNGAARAGLDESRLFACDRRDRQAMRRDGDCRRDDRQGQGGAAASRRAGPPRRCSNRRPASWRFFPVRSTASRWRTNPTFG